MPAIQYGSFQQAFEAIRAQLAAVNANLLSINIIFKVEVVAVLPSVPEAGDVSLLTTDNHLYVAIGT